MSSHISVDRQRRFFWKTPKVDKFLTFCIVREMPYEWSKQIFVANICESQVRRQRNISKNRCLRPWRSNGFKILQDHMLALSLRRGWIVLITAATPSTEKVQIFRQKILLHIVLNDITLLIWTEFCLVVNEIPRDNALHGYLFKNGISIKATSDTDSSVSVTLCHR